MPNCHILQESDGDEVLLREPTRPPRLLARWWLVRFACDDREPWLSYEATPELAAYEFLEEADEAANFDWPTETPDILVSPAIQSFFGDTTFVIDSSLPTHTINLSVRTVRTVYLKKQEP